MYRYAVENGYGSGFNEKWGIKHFLIIQEPLLQDETVLMTFIGLHNYKSATKHDNHFAYAITNKRFVMAQKQTIGEVFQTVYLDNINDVTFKSGMLGGIVTIDTIKEVFNVYIDKDSAKKVNSKILDILHDLKEQKTEKTVVKENSVVSTADEILKFKQLLDAGIITDDEFKKKKEQLMKM